MKAKVGRIVAWAVTIGLLAHLLSTVRGAEVLRAIESAPLWTVPALAALVGLVYLADSLAIWKTFGWFLTRLSFVDVLTVRGATYILAVVNYAIGQGAIIYFVNRARGVPVLRGAGAVLLVMGINVLLLLLLTSLGVAVAADVPPLLRTIVLGGYIGLGVYAAVLAVRPPWLARRPLFEVLFSAGIVGHLRAMAIRVPHLVSLVLLNYTALHAFGVKVPLVQAAVFLPIVYLVAVLPISVQGIGPTQTVMIYFFASYAPGGSAREVVLASSLVAQVVALFVQAAIGVFCLRTRLARDLTRARASAEPAST